MIWCNPGKVRGRLATLAIASVAITGLSLASASAQVDRAEMSRLHAALNLSDSQDGGWQAFVRAYEVSPEQEQGQSADPSRMDAPERMDFSISQAERYLDALKQRGVALKAFYATLSPQQKATFDRETAPPGP